MQDAKEKATLPTLSPPTPPPAAVNDLFPCCKDLTFIRSEFF